MRKANHDVATGCAPSLCRLVRQMQDVLCSGKNAAREKSSAVQSISEASEYMLVRSSAGGSMARMEDCVRRAGIRKQCLVGRSEIEVWIAAPLSV